MLRDISEFFQTHPVFTTAELAEGLRSSKKQYKSEGSSSALKPLLSYHLGKGHIVRLRRGLYWTVPPDATPDDCPLDPFLVASRMASDAVLGYHTALAFHGAAYSVWNTFDYLSHDSNKAVLRLRGATYRAVSQPAILRRLKKEFWGVETVDRQGVDVRVTTLERTVVDALDRLDLCGGYEEVWPCLEMIHHLKLQLVIEYTLLLENSSLAAKVGFFLEQHKDQLDVEANHLEKLRAHRPRQPHKVLSGSKDGKLISKWNLIIPASAVNREWEESSWQ